MQVLRLWMHEPNLFSFFSTISKPEFQRDELGKLHEGVHWVSNLPANSVIKIDNAYHQKCFINCEIHNLFILQLGKQILQQEHICNHLWFLILNSVWPHSNFANTVLKSTIFRHYCACPKRRNWGGKNTNRSRIVEPTIQRKTYRNVP